MKTAHNRNTPEVFWSRALPSSSGCWLWQGRTARGGYGHFDLGGKVWLAHRLAYTLAHGPIPEGLDVLHSCDTPACVNPAHLRAGTHTENMREMIKRGRRDTRGERHNQARLTWDRVRAIRAQYAQDLAAGCNSLKRIAAEHGVHFSTISLVVRGKIWTEAE